MILAGAGLQILPCSVPRVQLAISAERRVRRIRPVGACAGALVDGHSSLSRIPTPSGWPTAHRPGSCTAPSPTSGAPCVPEHPPEPIVPLTSGPRYRFTCHPGDYPSSGRVRDLHVCALDRELHLLDVLVPSTSFVLIATLGSMELIVSGLSSNHSSAAPALLIVPRRATEATRKGPSRCRSSTSSSFLSEPRSSPGSLSPYGSDFRAPARRKG